MLYPKIWQFLHDRRRKDLITEGKSHAQLNTSLPMILLCMPYLKTIVVRMNVQKILTLWS